MPTLLRIPWSHYCQKAEWGLAHQGIRYRTVDVGIARMARWTPDLPGGTVPILRADGEVIPGSERILAWADRRPEADHPGGLYPKGLADEVRTWEAWADEAIGPLARREAYRCIHRTPLRYTKRRSVHVALVAARPLVLKVLKAYKARRYEEQDADAVPQVLERVTRQLDRTGTGWLFDDHATAADLSTAALWAPMLGIRDHPARGEPWDRLGAYVRRVRPDAPTRVGRRWAREKDLADWSVHA